MKKGKVIAIIIAFGVFMLVAWAIIAFLNGPVAEGNAREQNCKDDGGVYVISRDFEPYCIKNSATIDLRS